jgi:Domain of unknown function (DUF5063)
MMVTVQMPTRPSPMDRIVFTARVRLVPIDEGGRKTPICSNYRPMFDLGETWQGHPVLNDGRVTLVERDELTPGEEGTVRIEPLCPEFWGAVRPAMVIPMQEGARIVGWATISEVTRAEGFSPAVATFVCEAREFCSFVEKAGTLGVIDRMHRARQHLLELYAAAVALPSVEPPVGTKAARSPEPPPNWSGFDAFETYWEIFDPYDLQAPVAGSLSDDLLDVYRDLRRGLTLWDSHHDAGAIWEWKFHFDGHWGDHAVDALRALHRACCRGGP